MSLQRERSCLSYLGSHGKPPRVLTFDLSIRGLDSYLRAGNIAVELPIGKHIDERRLRE